MSISQNIKAELLEIVRNLPDDCTYEDLQYQLYVRTKIQRAEESIARDGTVSHDEAKDRLARWLTN